MREGLIRTLVIFLVSLAVGLAVQAAVKGVQAATAADGALFGAGLIALAAGVLAATLSWYLFRRTDRLVSRRLESAVSDYRKQLGVAQAQQIEARKHLINGYTLWYEDHDLDGAIASFEEAVRAFPQGLGGYVALGYAYYSRGETHKALQLFQQALTLYPDRKEPYRDIASVYIREGDLLRALEYIERAIEVDPSIRRDILEDPLFDVLKHEERTRDRYEKAIQGGR